MFTLTFDKTRCLNHHIVWFADETEEQDPERCASEFVDYPDLRISNPLGLLTREYKHPLSMYEEAQKKVYTRYWSRFSFSSFERLNSGLVVG